MWPLFQTHASKIEEFYSSRTENDRFLFSDLRSARAALATARGPSSRAIVTLDQLLHPGGERPAPSGQIFVCLDDRHWEAIAALRRRFGADRVFSYQHDVYPALVTHGSWPCRRDVSAPRLRYIIWAPGRTGSTWLSDLLRLNGMGVPREHINVPFVQWVQDRAEFRPSRFAAALLAYGQVQGVFGTKVNLGFLQHVQFAVGNAGLARWLANLDRAGFRHILLWRRDVVQRAISTYVAERTGVWRKFRGETPPAPPPYDSKVIMSHLRGQHLQDRLQRWVGARLSTAKPVCYEELLADPEGQMRAILDYLGAAPGPIQLNTELEQERTELTLGYAARFERERGPVTARPPVGPGAASSEPLGERLYFAASALRRQITWLTRGKVFPSEHDARNEPAKNLG